MPVTVISNIALVAPFEEWLVSYKGGDADRKRYGCVTTTVMHNPAKPNAVVVVGVGGSESSCPGEWSPSKVYAHLL